MQAREFHVKSNNNKGSSWFRLNFRTNTMKKKRLFPSLPRGGCVQQAFLLGDDSSMDLHPIKPFPSKSWKKRRMNIKDMSWISLNQFNREATRSSAETPIDESFTFGNITTGILFSFAYSAPPQSLDQYTRLYCWMSIDQRSIYKIILLDEHRSRSNIAISPSLDKSNRGSILYWKLYIAIHFTYAKHPLPHYHSHTENCNNKQLITQFCNLQMCKVIRAQREFSDLKTFHNFATRSENTPIKQTDSS
ncbi:hypothetical protein Leryth_022371 [Lithospermum erythrorhizon]|nr:hypothetical protein Leryth_022371 [Lithospermum erythrorhizon]